MTPKSFTQTPIRTRDFQRGSGPWGRSAFDRRRDKIPYKSEAYLGLSYRFRGFQWQE